MAVKAQTVSDHPQVIYLAPQSNCISEDLQRAFEQAHQLWLNDSGKRRPVIAIPAGTFYIDDISGNSRGNYPFHMPPTFKLVGAGKSETVIRSAQVTGSQYNFLMIKPSTRLDVLARCSSLNGVCVSDEMANLGPSENVEIANITFENFDNVINLQEAKNCYIHDCDFDGSMVAIQLVSGDHYGNQGHRIEHCKFNATRSGGLKNRFCLRFEAPFSAVWTSTETGVPSLAECEALGGNAANYKASVQTCTVPDDAELNKYLLSLFRQSTDQDISNKHCFVSNCDFSYAEYSGIEFAGKLNIQNEVNLCSFNHCCGTAVEFDKGASFNKATYNLVSGMKPTNSFAPDIPYIFQAAIQEQEGSLLADKRLKSLISEMAYDDPSSANFLGEDIFYRAASLPQGNEISNNRFDISRSYWISQYETDPIRAAYLPDVYPSIKLRKPLDTKIFNNIEFIANSASAVTYDGMIGHSIVIYPDDELRDLRGSADVRGNKFYGAIFVVGSDAALKSTQPLIIDNNDFGLDPISPRGGISWNYIKAEKVSITNNRFLCAKNGSASVMQKLDITHFVVTGNTFTLPLTNRFYVRNLTATDERVNITEMERNTFKGGNAILYYDWTNGYNALTCQDKVVFNNNLIDSLSGSDKIVAVTLWAKNVEVNSNHFENFNDKIFQMYSFSDNMLHDGNNTLILGSHADDRAYSRDYFNTTGQYITDTFWG